MNVTTDDPRVALITGASGGMGRTAVRTFAEGGYRVVLADLSAEAVRSVSAEVADAVPGADLLPLEVDQACEDSLAAAADAVRAWSGRLDAVALFAGVVQAPSASVLKMSVAEWDRVQSINLRGAFLAARALVPLIPHDAGGSLTTISSWYGRQGHAYFSAYCASKAGVISLTQSLAAELAEVGIRVNSVAPGNIDTRMHRVALENEAAERGISFEEMRDIEWSKIPLKKAGPASSIVDAVYWLASDHSSYVTGATIDVNGGVLFV
ncbi:MAG: SDR family NAD(P)-dependent oxidoreductase [Propioniciclava sp.]